MMSPDCLSGPRKGSILDDIDDQVGAYMYQDEQGLGIIRAGSAVVGLRKRHKDHVKASKQANTGNFLLRIHPPPDQGSEKKGTRGVNFQQLCQVTGVRFKKSRITQVVVEMFSSWEKSFAKTTPYGVFLFRRLRKTFQYQSHTSSCWYCTHLIKPMTKVSMAK
jgi:hypothetical protein